ncbi:glycosyltransferase family 4 protein [uncultured Mucilaginibacter sp.]|uniref:glycosyltransferase family 4 protein n=1 Tax=uncultured Mucilaginibacter sp. TaxID=797541 RepID=UPI0025D41934|nr:glycosyltransferase family 4 protein [uncultured Mucilaginibacter sp.]
MKILILSNRVPFPQNGGYPIVVRNTILGLVNEGHEVSVFTLNNKKQLTDIQTNDELINRIHYQSYDIDISISAWDIFINLFRKKTYSIDRFYDIGFERLLITELKQKKYDIIQFEGLFMSSYVAAIRKNSTAKLIYRAHNIEHLIWQRLSEQKNDPFKKTYLSLLAKRIKTFELMYLESFDAIAALTQQDKQQMLKFGTQIPIRVLPVGIDISRYKPDYNKTEFPSLFFLGALDWMPNREGMEWFLENFSTELTEGDLRVKFYVAGHNIPDDFDDYQVLGKIFIQGEVDDALEFVNSKAIMIVPLLSGGGMRVKIVEAMAMQKCIITTSLGAEGLRYQHGYNILIADNRNEFHDAIKRCIADEAFCKEIGDNARKLIETDHDMNVVTAQFIKFYKELIKA